MDAITKAYELGAPYHWATITIKMGTDAVNPHALLRSTNWGYYKPHYSDEYAQTTKLIIESESGNLVTINHKLGDKFKFKVGAGLTLRNLKFDAIDSVINSYFYS